MLRGMERSRDTDLRGKRSCPHAAGQDNHIRLDGAGLRFDTDGFSLGGENFADLRVLENLRAAHPRAFRKSHRGVDRIYLHIRWHIAATNHAFEIERWPELA